MFSFTRNEQKFLLLFLLAIITGIAVNEYKIWQNENNPSFVQKEWIDSFEQQSLLYEHTKEINQQKDSVVGKININTATFEQLQTLPRIGPTLAVNIVEYRNQHGPFQHIEDIKSVNRIGKKTFKKIKTSITID